MTETSTQEGSQPDEITTAISESILIITLSRPTKKNALTNKMYNKLAQLLENSGKNPDIRCVMLTGSGSHFTAGNDLSTFTSNSNLPYREKPVFRFMNTLAAFEKPIIAAVNGDAIGIGVTLLLHCDLIYAAEKTQFKLPFLSLGLIPEFASTTLLPEKLGHAKSAELFFVDEELDCNLALELGIINKILPKPELIDFAYQQALTIAAKPSEAVKTTKRLMKKNFSAHIHDIIDEETREFSDCLRQPETQKILKNRLNKS